MKTRNRQEGHSDDAHEDFCGPEYKGMDKLTDESDDELKVLHAKFICSVDAPRHWMVTCPLCRSLEKGGDCQK
jgi:hypothetical protein